MLASSAQHTLLTNQDLGHASESSREEVLEGLVTTGDHLGLAGIFIDDDRRTHDGDWLTGVVNWLLSGRLAVVTIRSF